MVVPATHGTTGGPPAPGPATSEATPPPAPGKQSRRRPSATALVTAGTFLLVAAGLLWRNRTVFTQPLYEVGDAAANSLLINEAKSFELLVGHYSRVGFNHPGPGVLYLQAAGEALFTDLLGLTPAPHNGQVVAVMLLHAAVLAAVVGIVHSWCGRWPAAAAGLGALLTWYAGHQFSLAGPWIPVFVVAPFLLLLVASASVAAGRARHLWLLAAAGGLLVHAHVAFSLFVTGLAVAAVLAWAVTERSGPRALLRSSPRSWAAAGLVVAAFLAPIGLNTVLNWPGEIPKYLSYSETGTTISPTLADAVVFTRQFWVAPGPLANVVPLLLIGAAAAAAWWAPRGLRRPLGLLTAAALLAEALLVLYALVGIDDLQQAYIAQFAWSMPAALLLVVTVSVVARVRTTGPLALGVAVTVAVLGVVAFRSENLLVRPEFSDSVPATLAVVEQATDRSPVLVDVGPGFGPFFDGMALVLQLERADLPVCVVNPGLSVQVTPDRICTPGELARGQRVELRDLGSTSSPTFQDPYSDVTVLP